MKVIAKGEDVFLIEASTEEVKAMLKMCSNITNVPQIGVYIPIENVIYYITMLKETAKSSDLRYLSNGIDIVRGHVDNIIKYADKFEKSI